jgi:uncharacterized RDD family membrane protein YckC
MTDSTDGPTDVWTPTAAGTPAVPPTQPPAGWAAAPPPAYAVPDHALASPWVRLGAALLNGVLVIVTLGIGYLIWTLVLWVQGTNPGKKMCGLRIVKADTGRTCTFGDMLVRNFVMGWIVLNLIGTFTLGTGYLVDALMIFGGRNQRLIDRMSGTLVVKA